MSSLAEPGSESAPVEVFISVPSQSLAVVRDGEVLGKFPISTSKFGIGDSFGSYQTPLGEFRIYSKVGDGLARGAVMRGRHATGEVLAANAPGRDPIVTRILWLEGCEACNEHARARGIYIHGTPEEGKLGQPASYGCIRMRSGDVVKVFDWAPMGCRVRIEDRKIGAIVHEKSAERDARIAAIRKLEQQARVAASNALVQKSPSSSIASPSTGKQEFVSLKTSAKKPAAPKSATVGEKTAHALMAGHILDYESFDKRDTIPLRGAEVRLRTDPAAEIPPSWTTLAAAPTR